MTRRAIFSICFVIGLLFTLSNVSAFINCIDHPSPSDDEAEIDYSETVQTCVYVDVPQDCNVSIYFYENSSGSWVEYKNYTNLSVKGTYCGNLSVDCGTTYYWRVAAFINCTDWGWWENHTYSFTTVDCPVSHIYPSNNSVNLCPCCLALCAKFTNLSGDTMKFTFQSNYTGSWQNLEDSRVAPANETYCICVPEIVWFNYTYYWRVIYYDDSGANSSDIFSFTTAAHVEDCPCGDKGSGIIYVEENWIFAATVSSTLCFLIAIVLIFYFTKKRR